MLSTAALISAVTVVSAPTGAGAVTDHHQARQGAQDAHSTAARSARGFVQGSPHALHASRFDGYRAMPVQSAGHIQYVPFERTYRGLPVVGGDFVVATNSAGRVLGTTVAQSHATRLASVTARVTRATARATSARQVQHPTLEATRKVVLQRDASRLAWETTVSGTREGGPSRLTVYVDAVTGKVLSTKEHVAEGTGSSAWAGSVSIPTTLSGSTYSMKDSNASTLVCQDAATNVTFSGTDDSWGNGDATNRETGCVDAFYAAEQERQMLSTWLGRSGMDGSGGWVPIRVGLADVNAYYDGTQVQVGHTQTGGKWIGSLDVVAHEFGHGVDDHTPGGISGNGTQEFVADTFGAASEWYANNATDRPDYTVGEQVNLVGSGPIRYMYNPSLRRRLQLLHLVDAYRRGARGGRSGQPLVLPPRRGHQPDRRPADQPDLQQHLGHGPRHPEGHQDHVQRDADEDVDVVVPQVPDLDAHRGQEPVPGQLHGVQHGQGRLERRQRPRAGR